MLGMKLFNHYLNNYRQWRAFKNLPKTHKAVTGFYPSEPYFKYHVNGNFGGVKVMNFGCGKSVYKAPNVLNVDIVPGDSVTVRDPARSLAQFGRDFDFILANHVLEHVPNWWETLEEMAGILKPGGRLEVFVPPISSDSAFSFRDHINRIGIRSFDSVGPYANSGANLFVEHEKSQLNHLNKLVLREHNLRPTCKWWMLLAWPSLMGFFCQHLRNTVSEERFLFVKLP